MLGELVKGPDDILLFTVDWSEWLGSDTINSATWSAEAGITVVSSSHTSTLATAKLSGGNDRTSYDISNTIVTAGGETKEERFVLKVREP